MDPLQLRAQVMARNTSSRSQRRQQAITETIQGLQQPIAPDEHIIHAILTIQETDTLANKLTRRLRDWFELYAPEISHNIPDNQGFVNAIMTKDKATLLREIGASRDTGGTWTDQDEQAILQLAGQTQGLFALKSSLTSYIETTMRTHMPNLLAIAGAPISARLLATAGSLRRLAFMPASTIQILGADKAIFRHLHHNAPPPKHGIIHSHPLIAQARAKERGKQARRLANRIVICARADEFGNDTTIGEGYRKELERGGDHR